MVHWLPESPCDSVDAMHPPASELYAIRSATELSPQEHLLAEEIDAGMIVRMVVTAYGAQHMEYGTVERFAWHGSRASLREKLGLNKELPPSPAPALRVSTNVVDVVRALVREPTITLTHENRVQIMQAAAQFNQCQIDSKTCLCKIMAVVGKDVLIRCLVSIRAAALANSNAPAQIPQPPSTGKRTREARKAAACKEADKAVEGEDEGELEEGELRE